ncbi:MAG: V-type ATP synthase subunit I [Cellulosilyticaceae bacterium]
MLYGLNKERKGVLNLLQHSETVEVQDVLTEDTLFHKQSFTSKKQLLESTLLMVKQSLQILDDYSMPKKKLFDSFKGKKILSKSAYETLCTNYDTYRTLVEEIGDKAKEIQTLKSEILKLIGQKEILKPWQELDIPMNFQGTHQTCAFIGSIPEAITEETLKVALEAFLPTVINIIDTKPWQTCIFVMGKKENKCEIFDALRAIGFSFPEGDFTQIPKDHLKVLETSIATKEQAILSLEAHMQEYAKQRESLYFLQDYDQTRLEKYAAMETVIQSDHIFIMSGYIPANKSLKLKEKLEQHYNVVAELSEPREEEDTPVLLKNNWFSSPLEGTVEAFSPPGKHEVDPTMVMSLFYYALFGLMLSDAAYGVIMSVACGIILKKFKNTMGDTTYKTFKMFFFCGISTIFWGIMFGSYFGDIVDVVSATYFSQKISIPPVWFVPVNEPMRMLVICMIIGVIHLYTGLGMKLYSCIKQKDYKGILYDVVLWYVLLTSSIIGLLAMPVFTGTLGIKFVLSGSVGKVAGIIAIIAAVGITLTNGRESRNPFKRFLKGLYALYGITGYLSDVLSYSRLLALGLATGVICTVINKMASMVAHGPLGVILFIFILILGHSLNIAINALGAYVHTNRLQYVEFFGKFYEGGGRKFNPFKANTQYYKFEEDVKNG